MSIASRVTLRLFIVTLIATALGYGWLYLKQARVDSYLEQRTLMQQARDIAGYLSVDDDDRPELNLPATLSEAYNSPASKYRYIITDAVGRIVAISGRHVGPFWHIGSGAPIGQRGDKPFAEMDTALRLGSGEQTFTVRVDEITPRFHSLHAAVFNEFVADGGWLGIPFLFALLAIAAYTLRTSLSPLTRLSVLAAKISPRQLDIRLPSTGMPAEFLPLVGAINSGLDRLDEGLRRQQEFSANAAHQLRTPLAVLSANIDLMQDKAVAAKLRYDVDVMNRIVSQLLLVARLESLNIALDQPVELGSCAQLAAANLGPVAISSGKSVEVEGPQWPVVVQGNRVIVTAAISNLIENALKHTPTGTTVRVRVTENSSVEVQDAGPGVPANMREKIFERFWRGAESQSGAGLGLPIVLQIMRALNGTVSVLDAPEGGASFVLQFPPVCG